MFIVQMGEQSADEIRSSSTKLTPITQVFAECRN